MSSVGSSVGKSPVQYMLVPVTSPEAQQQAISPPPQGQVPRYNPQGAGQHGPYGIRNYGVQSYLPIAESRPLATEERADVQRGLSQWWPKIGAGYATPMWQLLASPTKSGLLNAGLLGAMGGLFGASMRHSGLAALCAAGGGVLGGVIGFINRRQQNENITDLMSRFPEGATKRDMLSDPVYQSDLNRVAMTHSGSGGDLLTGALLASSFNNYGATRRR